MPKRWIDYIRLTDLARAPRNPKDHDAELIQASLRRFGYVEAIALDERTGKLVAGHGRLDELQRAHAAGEDLPDGLEADEEGHWRVPVQRGWASADDAEAEAYVVTSNQAVIAGGWKPAELVDVLSDLDVICRRWAEHTGEPVIHAETGEPHPASLEALAEKPLSP